MLAGQLGERARQLDARRPGADDCERQPRRALVRVIGTLGIEAGVMVGVTGVLVLIFDTLASWNDGTV